MRANESTSRSPAPARSTGFATRPDGISGCSAATVVASSAGTSRPTSVRRSAAIAPFPPPSDMIATRRPRRPGAAEQRRGGVGQLAERVHEPGPGLLEGAPAAPARARPARRCGRPPRAAPAAERPAASTSTGFRSATRRTAATKGPAVAGVLDVAGGEPGLVVVGGRPEHVGHRHVGGVAEGHEAAVAEAVLVRAGRRARSPGCRSAAAKATGPGLASKPVAFSRRAAS